MRRQNSRPSRSSTPMFESLECRRLMSAGSVDLSFGPSGRGQVDDDYMQLNELPQAIAARPDDRLVVAGFVQHFDDINNTDFLIQGYTRNGLTDATVAPQHTEFFGGRDAATAVAIQSDGKVVAAGFAETGRLSNNADFAVVRYNANGTPDATFGNNGRATVPFGQDDEVTGMALTASGKVVLTGFSDGRFAAARLNANGTLDSTFGNGGRVTTSFPGAAVGYAMATLPGGQFIIAGTAVGPDGTPDFAMARYNANGTLDTTFGVGGFEGDGKVTTDVVPADGYHNDMAYAASVLPDGKILLAGSSFSVQGGPAEDFRINQYALARYNADGTPDTSFGGGSGNRTVTFGAGSHLASEMKVLPNGKILLGGSETLAKVFLLTRLNADGSPDLSFNGGTDARVGYSFGGTENEGLGLAVQSDGRIVMAGPVETNPRFEHNVGIVRFSGEPIVQPPPTITSVVINDGAAQRSQVTSVTITFDRPVTWSRVPFRLELLNTGGSGTNDGAPPTDVSTALRTYWATSPDGGRTWLIQVRAPYTNVTAAATAVGTAASTATEPPLGDGIYRLSVDPTLISANGVTMTSAPTFTFHRLFGDVTGNKTVNTADYAALRNAFGKSTGQAGYNSALDFDGNGVINNLDYAQFRGRYGKAFAY